MPSIRNINPMVRAIGTMGAVAALVGGITFAAATSNTVALTDNTFSVASAHLQLGLTNGSGCTDATDGPRTGMNFTNLVPGTPSAAFDFCLKNNGGVPLDITAGVPTDFTGSAVPPTDVTLTMTCNDTANTVANGTLDQFTGGTVVAKSVAPNGEVDCHATVEVNSNTTAAGASIKPFDIDFVGTQSGTV